MEISQNFVAFSEYMNFKKNEDSGVGSNSLLSSVFSYEKKTCWNEQGKLGRPTQSGKQLL